MENIVVVIGIAVVLTIPVACLVALHLLARGRLLKKPGKIYEGSIFGYRIIVSEDTLAKLVIVVVLYEWFDFFLPDLLAGGLALGALLASRLVRFRELSSGELTQAGESLLDKLEKMQSDIREVAQNIEAVGLDLISKQIDLREKEDVRQRLEIEIKKKTQEAEFWMEMTEEQKRVVADAAVRAVPPESAAKFWWGMLISFFINILATFTYMAMGNPGQNDMVKKFRGLRDMLAHLWSWLS